MEFFTEIFSYLLHFDEHLKVFIDNYGTLTYALLFLIIFAETGFVVTPFLPGDSLIFAAAAFSGLGLLNPWLLFILLTVAAIVGDSVNYAIGHAVGPRAFSGNVRFLKREYLDRTHAFYEKYGGRAIILARFVPIVRTFAPFVAGVGAMTYNKFVLYNVVGGLLWVGIFTVLGYFFGNIPFVQEHFETVIIAIVGLSLLPPIIEYAREKWFKKEEPAKKK